VRHRLPVTGPIDLEITFNCGQAFRWVRRADAWSGVVGGAEINARLDVRLDAPSALLVEIAGEDPGPAALVRYFRLDENPLKHLEHARELRDLPGLLPLFGLRLLRQDPWETLASFICSAAANVGKISACAEGMAARWGDPIAGSARRRFPSADRLARVRESGLRALGMGFRAPYLKRAAQEIASRRWSWEELREAPYERAREQLCGLLGVGPKIADCTLLFGLDRLEAYPVDRWIRRATMELASRRKATDEELSRWAERFGPGRGYLQQLIFHLRRTGGALPSLASLNARARKVGGG
jgi:N-glycosylase/DNA lyase